MRTGSVLAVSLLVFCFTATRVIAEVMTFSVNLGGVSEPLGHELFVSGTISLDPELPVGLSIQSSTLRFSHESDLPWTMERAPVLFYGDPSELYWSVQGDDLYINRVSAASTNTAFVWLTEGLGVDAFLQFGAGTAGAGATHSMGVVGNGPSMVGHDDNLLLKPASGPDGPTGFLVGTLVVPEPSSAMLLSGLGAAFTMRRKRTRR